MKVFLSVFTPVLAMVLLTSMFLRAEAQVSSPVLWVTWRAATYIPSEFNGRALVTPGSSLVLALDIVQNGKFMDLSGETIYWYMDGAYLTGGTGLTRVAITAPDIISQNQISIRASLPQTLGGVARTITIPIVSPQAVIAVVPPDPASSDNSLSFDVKADPYFFTTNDPDQLNFDWSVNGQSPSTVNDPLRLHINIPAGTQTGSKFQVHLKIENLIHAFESATQDLLLTVK